MGILWTILVGLIVGLVARLVLPGKQAMGLIMTTLLGVGGALVAAFAGQALGLYGPDEPAGFIGAVIGAVVLLVVFGMIRGKS